MSFEFCRLRRKKIIGIAITAAIIAGYIMKEAGVYVSPASMYGLSLIPETIAADNMERAVTSIPNNSFFIFGQTNNSEAKKSILAYRCLMSLYGDAHLRSIYE